MGASTLTVGSMMSILAALPMLLGVPAGRMVDRIGVRMPLLASVAGVGASVVLPGAFPGIAALYIAAACVGTSFMLFHISVQHAVGEGSAEGERKANFGWLALGFSISNFFGPTIAGLSIDHFGFRATFVLVSTFALADRKSTRLNSSHPSISYAVFCLKKKTTRRTVPMPSAPPSSAPVSACSRIFWVPSGPGTPNEQWQVMSSNSSPSTCSLNSYRTST